MIDTEKDNRKLVERALLIGIQDNLTTTSEAKEHLWELHDLVKTMDVPVIGHTHVLLKAPSPRYLLGSGKADEINELIKEHEADCLVFDYDLSPSQQRNWEKLTKICVIDRQEVILDIFNNRASTREAVIQVKLARMQYSLPRLTRAWTHLSRQRGGNKGTRGEGEQQIEVDKRLVQQKISQLKKELKEVRKRRDTQRKNRKRNELVQAAIVGYTNAGKSSLLNVMTDSDVLVEDKLFATLDPTTRRITLPESSHELLLTDTVGFVRKLPHSLVEAFKSTLEEASLSDFLIHVLDVSNPHVEDHYATTLRVLSELGAEDKKMLTVFNKIDLLENNLTKVRLQAMYPESIFISTHTGEGVKKLVSTLNMLCKKSSEIIDLRIPPSRHDIVSKTHQRGRVLSVKYDDDGWVNIKLSINKTVMKEFSDFCLDSTV